MNIRKIGLLVFSALLIFSIAACGSGEKDTIGLRGEITELILSEKDQVAAIMVEGEVESDTAYDKARVGITEDTKIVDSDGQEKSSEDLEVGMRVEVVFEGAVAESYPVQGKAKTIKLLE